MISKEVCTCLDLMVSTLPRHVDVLEAQKIPLNHCCEVLVYRHVICIIRGEEEEFDKGVAGVHTEMKHKWTKWGFLR